MRTTSHAICDVEALLAHRTWIRRLARNLCADHDEAEDLAQASWATMAEGTPGSVTKPWLGTVVRNLWRKRHLATARRQRREADFSDQLSPVPTPESLVSSVEVERRLATLVLQLREPYRQTVLLRYFEGQSASEIAAGLGVPAGTVRWRLKVGLEKLRRLLDEDHGDRSSWLSALAVLSPERADGGLGVSSLALKAGWPTAWATQPALLVGVTALVVVGVMTVGEPSGPRYSRESPESAPAASFSARAARPPTSSDPRALAACRRALQDGREELASLEYSRTYRTRPERLFAEGEANPQAKVALEPIVRRIMVGDEKAAPAYNLECRTWVCRIQVHQEDPGPPKPLPDRERLAKLLPEIVAKARREGGLFRPLPPGFPPEEARAHPIPDRCRDQGANSRIRQPSCGPHRGRPLWQGPHREERLPEPSPYLRSAGINGRQGPGRDGHDGSVAR